MLISEKWKLPGYLLLITGALLSILYLLFNFRFEIPVLALFSSYAETKVFTVFKTNFADETIMLSFLTGLGLVIFSKEKEETDQIKRIRVNSLIKTVIVYFFFLLFSILFVYGGGFMALLILNLFLPFIIYLFFFLAMKNKEIRNTSGPFSSHKTP